MRSIPPHITILLLLTGCDAVLRNVAPPDCSIISVSQLAPFPAETNP